MEWLEVERGQRTLPAVDPPHFETVSRQGVTDTPKKYSQGTGKLCSLH